MHDCIKRLGRRGFSLVEMAVILIIVSLVGVAAFGLLPKKDYEIAEKITKQNLDKVEKALLAFYNANGYLPCPASLTSTGTSMGTSTFCFAAPPAGTTDFTAITDTVRNGAVPIKALNIPTEFMFDGWGNRINYSLPILLSATSGLFDSVTTNNAITVIGEGGNVINGTNVAYFLSAPGGNRIGSYARSGVQILACSGTSDAENCDANGNFLDRALSLVGVTADFDDYVRWKTIKEVRKFGNFTGSGGGALILYGQWTNQGPAIPTGAGWAAGPSYNFNQIFNTTNASLSTSFFANDTIILPVGKYVLRGTVMGCNVDLMNAIFWSSISGNAVGLGIPQEATAATNQCGRVVVNGYRNVLTGSDSILLYPNFNTANAVDGTGRNSGVGFPYIYSEIEVWQIKNE